MSIDSDQLGEEGKPVVICVDDDRAGLEALGRVLRARCRVLLASDAAQALELVHGNSEVACVLADLRMPNMTGTELLGKVAQLRPLARRIIVTGALDADDLVPAINAGSIHFLVTKPWKLHDVLQIIDHQVHTHRLERDNARLLAELRLANAQLRDHERALEAQLEDRGREITAATEQLAQMGHQLDALTLRDALTGLYTHRAFQERLREEVARATRYGEPMALLIADVDQFASLNYDLGFQAGDEILKRIAALLQSDDRARAGVAARYSGEEFVLLLPETDRDSALATAIRLRDSVAGVTMTGDGSAQRATTRSVSISIGVACLPDDAADSEGLLTAAESALRGAKRGGSGSVHSFSAGDDRRRTTTRFRRLGDLELDRFRPYQERMYEVTSILQRNRALSCLLVDLSRLHRVEFDLGVAHHTELYDHAAAVLDRLRGELLDPADLICRTGDGDGYLVILAPRSDNVRIDLDALAHDVERAVEEALMPMVLEVLREQPRITVGAARVIGNSQLRPERLTARLVADAIAATRNLAERKGHRDRSMLQDVILGQGLSSVYQPIVDLGTGDIFAYEALTRGPRNTMLESPATLFAIADEVDLTVELDRACFKGALRNAMALEPVHRLFVNLLPMSFYDPAFIEVEVGNLLSSAGLTPANIVFEITERLAIENFASFKRALGAYTAMGFGVAIDDVGTRHSNLETVMSLRPHFIKISDVLVRGIARSTVKREMLRSLRHIAETIDAVMVAEGIEHVEDVVALRDLGLRYGQGYYIARPAPPFASLLDEVRAELRSVTPNVRPDHIVPSDDDDEDDRELAIPRARTRSASRPHLFGTGSRGSIPRSAFGREDEVTSEVKVPDTERQRPRSSQPPTVESPAQPWKPLVDDEGTNPGEPLIDSLRKPTENTSDPERGPGRPGLN